MEWELWVWRATASRGVRKSIAASTGLVIVWLFAFGPLVEWRQKAMMERLQPIIAEIVDVDSVPTD
ncbi:hypothetical protein IEZ26_06560 [Nocardioides cavernae]|uniref:Uncharacterized protein n=1 Tax=Nocardioides cavernae TaxID=1921566 RepID=A0ABR8N9K8_9ACTN|nr:hypothetical protein [Nocardioides cavernae]MBD3924277.1 hypothetical protein [Nocardioides cavernae]MBM7510783.1 hypothetical protein [Nocardioides cavernae]